MRRVFAVSAAVLALTGCGALSEYVPPVRVSDAASGRMDVISGVVDGDTVKVAGGAVSLRVLGIDSPETRHPSKPVECGGPESTAWAQSQLPEGTPVRVEFEPGREQTDRYGRLLGYVIYRVPETGAWVDFSVESARAGMSFNYIYDSRPVSRQSEIAAAEAEARDARRGIWGFC